MSDLTIRRVLELVAIADKVLAGEPIDSFDLPENEVEVVLTYTRARIDRIMDGGGDQ